MRVAHGDVVAFYVGFAVSIWRVFEAIYGLRFVV